MVDAPKIAEDREASMFTFDLLEPLLVPPYPAPEFEEYKDPELMVSLKLMPIRVMPPMMFGYSNRCRQVESWPNFDLGLPLSEWPNGMRARCYQP